MPDTTESPAMGRRTSRGSLVSFDLETSRGRSTSLSVYEDLDEIQRKELDTGALEGRPLLGGDAAGGESFWNEIVRTWALAWPVVSTFFLQVGPGLISMVFLGHLPKKEYLAAGTLATMYIHMTGNTIIIGMSTALDTLLSQAYGSGQLIKVGIIFQRSLWVLMATSVPLAVLWWFSEEILLFTGESEEIAHLAGEYIRVFLFGLWAIVVYEPLKKYLQCQGIVKPVMMIALADNLLSILMNYLFIYAFDWGFVGAALARGVVQWLLVILTLFYMRVTGEGSSTWGGFTAEAFEGWGDFLGLAIPGLVMFCAEGWAFQIQTWGAGLFGTAYLSAQSVILQIILFSAMLPVGMSVAGSIRVGNFLGNGQPEKAKRAAYSALSIGAMSTVTIAVITYAVRYQLPKLFTDWDEAIQIAADVTRVVCLCLVFDGMQIICSGILRGVGKQKYGAILNVLFYYAVGIPLGFFFGFKLQYHTSGLYAGLLVAIIMIFAVMLFLIFRFDWKEEVIRARARVGADA